MAGGGRVGRGRLDGGGGLVRGRGASPGGGGPGCLGGAFGGGGEGRLGQRRGEDRGDLGAGGGRRRADAAGVLGADGLGDPGPVEDPALVGLGDQVLGLVVVAVGGLYGPEVDGDPVFLGGHQSGQQIAVAGHQDDVGAGPVAGQFGQLRVHRGVDALLRPAPVAAGQGAQPYGHAGHHAEPAVFGLGHPVGGSVEPVDAQQRLLGVGLGSFAQSLDEGRVIHGDAGTRGLSGQQTRGCAQQVAGVHQDDATVTRSTLFQDSGAVRRPLPGDRARSPRVFVESARPRGA